MTTPSRSDMPTKTCKVCGRRKPLTDFYRADGMADGRYSKCKECYKIAVKERRAANLEQHRAYDRQRANEPHRVAAREAYKQTKRGKERLQAGRLAWIERNPDARNAHIIVGNAIRDGRLIRGTCRFCGDEGHHAHHNDYSKPLKVWWLCRDCHVAFHKPSQESSP